MFDYNRAEIRSTEMGKIADIAVYTSPNPSVRLGIDGSTDLLRGTNQYNAVLSQQRVGNVRDALIRAGVAADRIETGGFGAERAKCNDANELCGQRDGRVEVMVRPASQRVSDEAGGRGFARHASCLFRAHPEGCGAERDRG